MRIISFNANGIRSATQKGFGTWLGNVLHHTAPTVCCVQETKAQPEDLSDEIKQLAGLSSTFYSAEKKGYSGVAFFTNAAPKSLIFGFDGGEFDAEGRLLEMRLDTERQKLSVISAYFPSGSSGPERQEAKFRFLKKVLPHLMALKAEREVILCGDINIAHQPIDLKNWKSNQKNSGFLPEEREWLTALFAAGWVDVFRTLNPASEQYTWWSARGQAYAKNVGWRLDYQIATPGIAERALREHIYTAERFSDHAPLVIDYER